jgi:hypothetical protein
MGRIPELFQRLPDADGSWMIRPVGGLADAQG